MLLISKLLFEAWNNNNISYCHWKSNEHLLPGLNGETDLDILLSELDKIKGTAILKSLNFLECKSQYGSRYPHVEDWIGYDIETGKMIHVHLHYQIITGHKGLKEFDLPWTSRCLDSRILHKEYNVYIMEPNLEIVTLYSRIALKISIPQIFAKLRGNFKLSKDSIREIEYLRQQISLSDVHSIVDEYFGKYADQVFSIIRNKDLSADSIFELKNISETVFSPVNRVGRFFRLYEAYFRVSLNFRKLIHRKFSSNIIIKKTCKQKGLTIAFLGQDGAGKTTVTKDLMKWLSWKLDVRNIYLGSGDNYFSWRKSALKIIPNKSIFNLLRAWIVLTKYTVLSKDVYKYIVNGEAFAKKGCIIIFDRYPQNIYPGISDGPKIRSEYLQKFPSIVRPLISRFASREEANIEKSVSHTPDVVIKLILPPEESLRRKPEENIEAIRKKHEIIKKLPFNGSDVYTIDATMPYDEELLLIKKIIWDHIQKS